MSRENESPPPPSPPPPRGPRLRIGVLVLAVAILALLVGSRLTDTVDAAARGIRRAVARWTGSASEEADSSKQQGGEQEQARFYTCGMHPWVILPAPGDCPICHMKLTPLDPSKFTGEIAIDPVVVQNIGVRVAPVTKGPVVQSIRTVGSVAYDETRVRDINTKIDGWIEKLYVDYVGAEVKAGDPLFEIFSRRLYSAQEEYLIAWRGRKAPGVEFVPAVADNTVQQLESARTRLELFDITDEEIRSLEESGKPSRTMMIRSPYEGIVVQKHAFEGMKLESGTHLYRIADLSRVWVMVTLYEYQLPFVSLGQKATMTLPYIPGETFEGRVTYIYPWVEPKTREVRIRLEFDNPGIRLKPGMFVGVRIESVLARERVLAPRSAVLDTGERKVSFVSLGRGRFEPRDVRLGPETEGGMVAILDGLRPGEMVVTSGQFLLDSESKIREALGKMIRGDMASDQKGVSAPAGTSELTSLPEAAASSLRKMLDAYLRVGDALSRDTLSGVKEAAREVAAAMDALVEVEIPGQADFWRRHDETATIRGKALELVGMTDLEPARLGFADLSVSVSKLLGATGVPPDYPREVRELHCPMFREGQGGSVWLEAGEEVRNPFFGSAMPECFAESRALPVTGAAKGDEPSSAPRKAPPPDTEKKGAGPVSPELQGEIDRLLAAYLEVQEHLARDDGDGAAAGMEKLSRAAGRLEGSAKGTEGGLAGTARRIGGAVPDAGGNLAELRVAFRDISEGVIALVRLHPPTRAVAGSLRLVWCPMAKAPWLQLSERVRNPYYGSEMIECGTIREVISAVTERDR